MFCQNCFIVQAEILMSEEKTSVATPALWLLGLSLSGRLRVTLQNTSLLCIFVPPHTSLIKVVNSGSLHRAFSEFMSGAGVKGFQRNRFIPISLFYF